MGTIWKGKTRIQGIEALLRKFDMLGKVGAKRVARAAVRTGTAVIAAEVKRQTPVDEGELKKTEASKVFGRGYSFGGVVGGDANRLKGLEAARKRPSNLDWLNEFGHVTAAGYFVPPNPFMQRAAAASMPSAERAVARSLKSGVERELSR